MDAIRTEGLSKQYSVGLWRSRPYVALDSLSLQVERGEVFGFLGPNGAGKTTTIRCLLDFLRPTSGSVQIFGLDNQNNSVELKHRIGYLSGYVRLYDKWTGRDHIRARNDPQLCETGSHGSGAGTECTRASQYSRPGECRSAHAAHPLP